MRVASVLRAVRNVNQVIVHEEDPQRLIERACGSLTEERCYHNAWIALLDGDGRTVAATAAAGFEGQFDVLRQRLARGAFSACMRQALDEDATIVVRNPSAECADCPLAREYGGRAGFTRRLAFEGRTYGILAVSVPAGFAHDAEEQSLFDEVADDLGFALHKIELQARLREADSRVRAKLNALFAPEGDIGDLSLDDVLDVPAIQRMMDDFHGLTGMCTALLDIEGRILVAAGWQEICTGFHRSHPETCRNCVESDTVLSSGVKPGTFKLYHCRNNMWDMATPVMLGDRHVGNLFIGQFLFEGEEPERDVFRQQALKYGFDEAAYLGALDRLPRWSRERVASAMNFFAALARQISDLSYGNIRLARALAQRDELLGRLAYSEERLRLALKATNDVVWDWDIANDAQRWSETGAAAFGWTDIVAAPQTVAWWVDRIHTEDRQRVYETFHAAVRDPGTDRWNGEYRFLKADGTYAHVVDRGNLLRDEAGRAIRMIGAKQDVTERKRAEEALRESETRFRFLVDYSYDLIWTLKSDGVLSYASPSWKTRLGYEPSDMVGQAFQPFVHPDDLAACEAYVARVFEARTALPGPEYRVGHADGSWRWHEAGMTPVYAGDGSFMYFVGVSRDITERKQAEEALKASDMRFKELLLNVPTVAVQGYALDGTVRYWNRASEAFYGYTAEEALAQNLLNLIIPPAMRDNVRALIGRMVETREALPAAEVELMRKDGSLIPVYSSHALVQLPGQEPELFCIDIDLTELRQTEAEQDKLQAQFLHAQKMESVGRLAGGVAHDFNNLLMGIMGYTDLCREQLTADHPLQPWLDEITAGANRSADLVRQLLTFARKQVAQPKALDLNDQIGSMLKMLRRLIGERIDLTWSPAASLRIVNADPSHIDQVVANLCVNAADAVAGNGRIAIATHNAEMDEMACAGLPGMAPGAYVLLTVADTGCGMDADTLAHAFEPFFTTKGVGRGTGLGLATVYGIVKQSDGFIQVDSALGAGTTFGIYLPALGCPETGAAPLTDAEPPPGGSETILVVDDEKSIRVTMAAHLRRLGYTVLVADGPEMALRLAREHSGPIELLLSDMAMPGMSGGELQARLLLERPNVKTILITGYTTAEFVETDGRGAGAVRLAKPLSLRDLASALRSALGERRAETT
jgi:PAS domain S-box-containing protein